MNDKPEYDRIKNTELREEIFAGLLERLDPILTLAEKNIKGMEKLGDDCYSIAKSIDHLNAWIVDLITKRETEAYERGVRDNRSFPVIQSESYYKGRKDGIEDMKKEMNDLFQQTVKTRGLDTKAANQLFSGLDEVAEKLKGEV